MALAFTHRPGPGLLPPHSPLAPRTTDRAESIKRAQPSQGSPGLATKQPKAGTSGVQRMLTCLSQTDITSQPSPTATRRRWHAKQTVQQGSNRPLSPSSVVTATHQNSEMACLHKSKQKAVEMVAWSPCRPVPSKGLPPISHSKARELWAPILTPSLTDLRPWVNQFSLRTHKP